MDNNKIPEHWEQGKHPDQTQSSNAIGIGAIALLVILLLALGMYKLALWLVGILNF